MASLSENIQSLLSNRLQQSDQQLNETRQWIEKMRNAGFTVSDLESKQRLAEQRQERLRMLL